MATLKDIKYIKIWALLQSVGRYQKVFMSVCFYLEKELYNTVWNFLVQVEGKMEVITREEVMHG